VTARATMQLTGSARHGSCYPQTHHAATAPRIPDRPQWLSGPEGQSSRNNSSRSAHSLPTSR